jgi:NAD(P)-dependent dehydrogenase (short-subunit alcohol dehydrogenase family)
MLNYLVIGASSGIGEQLTLQLLNSGNKVYGSYNTKSPISTNSNLEFFKLNVVEDKIDLSFLPDQINGLVYCPGSINLKPFDRIKPEDFENDYKLQVTGAIKVLQQVLPKLKMSVNASVVLFSSIAVQTGLPFHTQVAASKGALEGLTKALAAEYAPKIRVNAIAPSLTQTPLANNLINTEQKIEANAQRHPLKRIGSAADIANMAEFLLSDKASWITGQIFHVDGGMGAIK